MNNNGSTVTTMVIRTVRPLLLWVMFAGICFGLGYPTLNRYDPRVSGGNTDSQYYYRLVTGDSQETTLRWRYRILVPFVARPFYQMAIGNVKSWNPVWFGLLCANSIFCATTLLLLTLLAGTVLGDGPAGLICALLYAANFAVANGQLAGLVDSGEAMFLLLVAWFAYKDKWGTLPFVAIGGALAKETFVPISTAFLAGWLLVSRKDGGFHKEQIAWLALSAFLGVATATIVRSVVTGEWVLPWAIASSERAMPAFFRALFDCIFSKGFVYVFFWLLPLGLLRLRMLPRPWLVAASTGTAIALLLGVWTNAGGNVARPMFAVIGPVLCASAAKWLCENPLVSKN